MSSAEQARTGRILPIAALVLVVALVATVVVSRSHPAANLEVFGTLPDFSLTDQQNQRVTRDDLTGHTVIANFIFTRCPTVCPTFTMKMSRVAKRLKDDDVVLISFSVDPEYDTPEVLRAFGDKFHADPKQWLFLTGDPTTLTDSLTKGLAIAMEKRGTSASGAPNIVHDTHFVLIDGKHRIRGYYDSNSKERIDALVRDARGLAND